MHLSLHSILMHLFLCPGIVLALPVHVSVEIFILAIISFAYIQALSCPLITAFKVSNSV